MPAKTVTVQRPELNFWEKIYLPEIFRGLWITASKFWRNIFVHTAHRLGLMKSVEAAVTIQYPEEMRPTSPRLRTRHRLTQREDGSPRCVSCMMCETVCPAHCIYIVAGEHPDPNVEKAPKSFVLDLGKCVYCGFCVEACPEDAIRMDTQIHTIAAYSREEMILDMQELLNPSPGGMPQKTFYGKKS
ncbi:MAG: NADH-quinone oxidoreductase subunit I [Candidatus Omnitrophica bacterium]|nr:NADH-quinone oxidoreductase subunit I [Candidatus Omnitrophota bacterium]